MKNFIFSLSFILFVNNVHAFAISDYEKKIKTNYNVINVTEKISRDALEKNLRDFLASGRPSRVVGASGHQKAMEYIEERLKAANSKGTSYENSEFNPKLSGALKNFKGHNLIWEKKGISKPNEIMILGANYDTILKDPKTNSNITKGEMPGADNNGTGVAALLSMIEILDKLDLPKTVRIVFFDAEELGLLGSRDYIEKLKDEKITGFINLFMLGNDSKRDDKEKKLNNMKVYSRSPSESGSADDLKLVTMMINNGKRLYSTIEFLPSTTGTISSSHNSFWEAKIPAICFSQNWESDFNPRFHTPNDFVETLNINTYANAFRYITGSLIAWNYDIVK